MNGLGWAGLTVLALAVVLGVTDWILGRAERETDEESEWWSQFGS